LELLPGYRMNAFISATTLSHTVTRPTGRAEAHQANSGSRAPGRSRADRFLCNGCALAGVVCAILFVVLVSAAGFDRPDLLAALSGVLPWAGLALLAALAVLALISETGEPRQSREKDPR